MNKKIRRFCNGFKKEAEGFTYVETVAVIAIGAVLTAGSLFSASKIISDARKTAAKTQIEQFGCALQTYFLDCGRFPTTEQGLSALWEKPVLYPVPVIEAKSPVVELVLPTNDLVISSGSTYASL